MDQDKLKNLSDEYRKHLTLEGFPAAVKMIEKMDHLGNVYYKGKPVNTLKKNLMVCQLISQARYYGRVITGLDKNLDRCRLGGDAMGFEVTDYTHVYAGTYFSSEEAAKKMIADMPKFKRGQYQAIMVGPLDRIPIEPDVVVIYGNVAQMLRIINGYLYSTGNRLNFSTSGDAGLCSDIVVIPMITGKPHLAIPCNGGRLMSLPNQTEMAFGIPFKDVEHILEGIEFTGKNVPIIYPTAWQHIDWEAPEESPIDGFVQPERHGKKDL